MSQRRNIRDDGKHLHRRQQFEQIGHVLRAIKLQLDDIEKRQRKQLAILQSVSQGLYDEVDKLCKKAPAEEVTNLVLEQANDVIREIRELVADDSYVQRIKEFVPAGDNPQHRDVVVVLRQLRQGLGRFEQSLSSQVNELTEQQREANVIAAALEADENGETADYTYLKRFVSDVPSVWIKGDGFARTFDFDRLDRTDLVQYFGT